MSHRRPIIALAALCLLAPVLGAQAPRLESRLDARTRAAVERIVDSARAAGLPTEPLIDKALEGASKGADGLRIISAVGTLSQRLGIARAALGPEAPEAELVAAAGALHVGVRAASLARLKNARPGSPIATPLVVLSDLIARGVPADTAASAVITLAERGASTEAFVALRSDVVRAISDGAPPAIAASVRARGGLVSTPSITQRPGLTDVRTLGPTGGEQQARPRKP